MSDDVTRRCKQRRREAASLDRQFDRLIPDELRHLSTNHWTPVQVAVRVAALLCPSTRTRVLDVGAGIGKVCSIGALSTYGTWTGVEQHEPLVSTATRLAQRLGVARRTRFVQGDALSLDWSEYDALYFYNPFELSLFGDHSSEPHDSAIQIARVQCRLATLPRCTRVVTFHGFGGVMPESFELIYHERVATYGLDLALWVQRSRSSPRRVVS